MKIDPIEVAAVLQKFTLGEERIMAAVGHEAQSLKMSKEERDVLCVAMIAMLGAQDKYEDVARLEDAFSLGITVRDSHGRNVHLEGYEKPKD